MFLGAVWICKILQNFTKLYSSQKHYNLSYKSRRFDDFLTNHGGTPWFDKKSSKLRRLCDKFPCLWELCRFVKFCKIFQIHTAPKNIEIYLIKVVVSTTFVESWGPPHDSSKSRRNDDSHVINCDVLGAV